LAAVPAPKPAKIAPADPFGTAIVPPDAPSEALCQGPFSSGNHCEPTLIEASGAPLGIRTVMVSGVPTTAPAAAAGTTTSPSTISPPVTCVATMRRGSVAVVCARLSIWMVSSRSMRPSDSVRSPTGTRTIVTPVWLEGGHADTRNAETRSSPMRACMAIFSRGRASRASLRSQPAGHVVGVSRGEDGRSARFGIASGRGPDAPLRRSERVESDRAWGDAYLRYSTTQRDGGIASAGGASVWSTSAVTNVYLPGSVKIGRQP